MSMRYFTQHCSIGICFEGIDAVRPGSSPGVSTEQKSHQFEILCRLYITNDGDHPQNTQVPEFLPPLPYNARMPGGAPD